MTQRAERIIQYGVLSTRPEFRDELLRLVTELKEQGVVERQELYECTLQTYLFAGFPAAIESARVLSLAWPEISPMNVPAELREEKPLPNPDVFQEYLEQGRALYRTIYSAKAEIVTAELTKLSPELAHWAVTEGYGKTLSRPGLDIKTRELAIVGMLTQLGWTRQLYSHILGSYNVDATVEEIEAAIYIGAKGDSSKSGIGIELLKRLR